MTFFTKYILTSAWLFGVVYLPISNYYNFGQVEIITVIPFLVLALIAWMPMKISFDNEKIVISDWLKDTEYKYENIKSLTYSRTFISIHPYKRLIFATDDNLTHKIYFMPRYADISIFSNEPQGRQDELLELWSKTHNR